MAMMGYAAPANWSNALAIMGAALKDASPGSNGDALAQTQNLLAQRSMMNARLGLMQQLAQMQGGQPVSTVDQVNAPGIGRSPAPMATTPAVPANDPRWQQLATQADMLGMPLTSTLKMLELNRPHLIAGPNGELINDIDPANAGRVLPNRTNINGTVVDLNDAKNTNRFVSAPPVAGATPVYDKDGNITDWTLPKGVQQTIQLQQAPQMLRAQAAALDASTGVGRLRKDQSANAYAPPPGFKIRPPKGSR